MPVLASILWRLPRFPRFAYGVFLFLTIFFAGVPSVAADSRTWKYLNELSEAERQNIDPRTETPRDATLPYLPAEPYPFTPPYTAEEMGIRSMEFPHMPRWNFVQIEDFGSLMPTGSLSTAKTIVLGLHVQPEGLDGYLKLKPGEVFARWLSQDTAPAENLGNQMLMVQHRTDQQVTTKADMFGYSPVMRRVRRFPQPRRQDRFPDQPVTFDDFLGRDAWEFHWRIIGTDVLTETVRFPVTRQSITLAAGDGSLRDAPVKNLKLMGNEYPYYTAEGGVPCYVVEAKAKSEWLGDYYAPRILYWLDQHYFYPLRTETYSSTGELISLEDRIGVLYNPALKERGYHNLITVWWNAQMDFLGYSVHDGHRVRQWTEKDSDIYFNPDFMRRVWFPVPLKTQATVKVPEDFFLRPHLYRDKFPEERKIIITPEVDARVQAQDAAGRLVFTEKAASGQ
ncbi:MAG: outer membrane lipoprotein-sorting protein [Deltaproteobacteria bacterium]|nr:outer membrane lipoprotein-sorting protein [Deltaproteobacteria bacterium]